MMDYPQDIAGSFCWGELMTSDQNAAKKFYGDLFGWEFVDIPMPQGVYTMCRKDNADVGAITAAMPGVPNHWGVYFMVENADASAAKAKELGGKVMMGPFDIPEAGRMAVIQDPQGPVCCLFQPGLHKGATYKGAYGMITWPEVYVPDAAAAVSFYGSLFGWKTKPESDFDKAEYVEWVLNGVHIGGLMPMRGDMWKGVPPHWMLYVTVADCAASAGQVKELGGNVCVGPHDIPNVGKFAVVNDPQGVTFSIIQLTGRGAEARGD
jgi:predicted enzyme related to lactoylglutathione lyase